MIEGLPDDWGQHAGPQHYPSTDHARALGDPLTRRCLLAYIGRVSALLVAAIPVGTVGVLLIGDDGDVRPGVPEPVLLVVMTSALLLIALGALSLLNVLRMLWVLARWPWYLVSSGLREVGGSATPNGQPVLTLQTQMGDSRLTLAALRWRWDLFRDPDLLLAGRPRHGGVVMTTDGRNIAWAGRSPFTAFLSLVERLGRRDRAVGGPAATSGTTPARDIGSEPQSTGESDA